MAISRQSDSIWVTAAMGEGRQDHDPSRTHSEASSSAHNHGRSMGEKHAHEAWRTERRDENGRFVASGEHHKERHESEGRHTRGEERDAFVEGYHSGFDSAIRHHEKHEGYEKKSSMFHQAVDIDPNTGQLSFNDGLDEWDQKFLSDDEKRDRFRYKLEHGTTKGWKPKTPMDRSDSRLAPEDDWSPRGGVTISERNPAAAELDSLAHYARDVHGVPLSDKYPFSDRDLAVLTGQDPGRRSRARGKLPKGSLASEPMETTDANGVKHTFWHQVSTEFPVDDGHGGVSYQTEYPGAKMAKNELPRVTVALHHFRSDTGLQPPMVSTHTLSPGSDSTSRVSDLNGMFRTNDQTRLLHSLGVQRVGDWNNEIKFNYQHPNGQIAYTIQRVNGDDSRFPNGGKYYDPDLGSKTLAGEPHPDYVGEKWVVTPHTLERKNHFDADSPMFRVAHNPVEFSADNDHGFNGMIQHVLTGQGTDELARPYSAYPQNQMKHDQGLPPGMFNPKTGSIRPWQPSHNIHRSAERLPLW